uniref:Ionotropic receptor 7d3 n=1 Tax=Heliconius melpomene rosina TaxID=171916 RepID=A0A140G9H2_HELME|nr:ionotropic receptor 7d3 [Heliconius melpomene rosina]
MRILVFILVIFKIINILECTFTINKAVSIANKVFTYHKTAVVWWSFHVSDINKFLQQFRGTVLTVSIENHANFNDSHFHKKIPYIQTIFFAMNPYEFDYFLEKVNYVRTVPINLILVLNEEYDTNLTMYTKIAWEKDVSDILIISNNSSNEVIVSTFKPYRDGVCGDHTPMDLKTDSEQFFMRKYTNFYKCPIRITLLEHKPYVILKFENDTVTSVTGMEGNLLMLLLNVLNSTANIVSCRDHGGFSGTINGTMGFSDLYYNRADLMVPALIMQVNRYLYSQISYAHDSMHIVWCMPTRREIYEWAKVILPFFNILTPFIIVSFLIMLVTINAVKKYALLQDNSKNDVAFRLLGIFMGQDTTYLSRYWLVNSLFVCWIWLCMIIRISYQGNLVDGLQKTILEPRLSTLEEAVDVVDQVGGMRVFVDFYRNTSLEKKYVQFLVKNVPSELKKVGDGKRNLIAADRTLVQFYRHNLEILDEPVMTTPICIHMRPRWPAAPEISQLISRVVEAGLYTMIIRKEHSTWMILYGNLTETYEFKPIKLKTFHSCFYGLIIMYVMSSLVLVGEICFNRYKRREKY